jgi:hypothetical protein
MSHDGSALDDIEGLFRIETTSRDAGMARAMEMTRSVYPHDEVYGQYCTLQDYIDCPPDEVYRYLSDPRNLAEWTFSMRDFRPTEDPELWVSLERLADDTQIYTRTVTNAEAMTVDFHCAWDQSEHLWMIYLIRVVPAQLVLNKPGSVVIWSNCKHPFYDENAYPETAPESRDLWVGDVWDLFFAGHLLELRNFKAICESRHAQGLPVSPERSEVAP